MRLFGFLMQDETFTISHAGWDFSVFLCYMRLFVRSMKQTKKNHFTKTASLRARGQKLKFAETTYLKFLQFSNSKSFRGNYKRKYGKYLVLYLSNSTRPMMPKMSLWLKENGLLESKWHAYLWSEISTKNVLWNFKRLSDGLRWFELRKPTMALWKARNQVGAAIKASGNCNYSIYSSFYSYSVDFFERLFTI